MQHSVLQWLSCFVLCYKSSAPLSFTAVWFQGRPFNVGGSARGNSPRLWLAFAGRTSSMVVCCDLTLTRLGKARGEGDALKHPLPGARRLVLAVPSLPAGRDRASLLMARLWIGANCPQCGYVGKPTRTRLEILDPVSFTMLCGCAFFAVSPPFIFIQPMCLWIN